MINLDINDIVLLKRNKHLVQDTLFGPAISAHIGNPPHFYQPGKNIVLI